MNKLIKLSALLLVALFLASCIGGGSGPSTYTAEQVMSGTVTDADQPLPGIHILVGDSIETTNDEGEWQATFTGRTRVQPHNDDYTFTPEYVTVDAPCQNVNFVGTATASEDSTDEGNEEVGDSDSDTDDTEDPVYADLDGRVRYADTQLPLHGTVTVSDHQTTTNAGQFSLTVPTGSHTYTLNTLLGEASGSLQHNGTDYHNLVFPGFPGWSQAYFDQIMFWDLGSSLRTIRWPRGRTISVWIQPHTVSPRVSSGHVDLAWDTMLQWQSRVNPAISFSRVSSEGAADLKWFWGMPSGISSAGLCRVLISGSYIQASEIYISLNHLDNRGIYLHEAGHSIGLAHSPDNNEVMHPIVYSQSLREREINAAQLLYSIPAGTEPLGSSVQALSTTPVTVETGPDGTWLTIE